MAAIGIAAPGVRRGTRLWEEAALSMALAGLYFYMAYSICNWAAAQRQFVPSMAFGWERNIPFAAWTIVPYWSLNLFYIASFFLCRTREELRRHLSRVVAAQTISAAVFLIFPLRFGFARPETQGLFSAMFGVLDSFDLPFNQAPSLHVSLAVIVAARFGAHLSGTARLLLCGWFALIAASALTTYQHHFFDIPTGVWVGALCCAIFPDVPVRSIRQQPHWMLSATYSAGFALLATAASWFSGWALWLLWPAGSCLIVASVYGLGRPELFAKRNGSLPLSMRLLLAPYLGAARVNGRMWTRNAPPTEIAPGLWVGRVVDMDARFRSMVDLTAELSTIPNDSLYKNVPVLDLTVPSIAQIDTAVAAIESVADHRPTLVCCAMGYSRGVAAAAAWILRARRASTIDEAIAIVRGLGPRIALRAGHRARLAEWAGESVSPPKGLRSRIVSQALVFAVRLIVGAEARWTGCQRSRAQRIYVANHTSHADFVVLWSALPADLRHRTHPVAAADYWKQSKLRYYIAERVFGSVLVERGHVGRAHNPLRAMRTAIEQGKSLVIFPEGTRGYSNEPGDFKCGIYHLARRCPDVELVPVRIANVNRVLPKGSWLPAPLLCSVTFGTPTRLAAGEEKQEFLARLRRSVIETGGVCPSATKCS